MTDLVPVSQVAVVPNVLVVHKSLPVKNVKELVQYARANPGKLNFSSAGIGSSGHLAGELFKHEAKIDIVHGLTAGRDSRCKTCWPARCR